MVFRLPLGIRKGSLKMDWHHTRERRQFVSIIWRAGFFTLLPLVQQ